MSKKSKIEGMVWPGHRHDDAGTAIHLIPIHGLTKHGLMKHSYHFQVPPLDEFGWDSTYNWIDFTTIRSGQYTRDGGPQLKVISFRTMVVDYNPSWAVWQGGRHHRHGVEPGGRAPNPQQVSFDLDKILEAGTPFRLLAWNRALQDQPEVDLPVSFRTLSVREQAGEPDSRYFDMSFTEYRSPLIGRRGYGKNRQKLPAVVQIKGDGSAAWIKRDGDPIAKDHQHTIGDAHHPATLRKLAKFFYGEHRAWVHIKAKNGINHFGPDDSLAVLRRRGQRYHKLTIPKWKKSGKHHGSNGGH